MRLIERIFEAAARHPDRPALRGLERTWSYSSLASEVDRLASALSRMLPQHARVVISRRKSPEAIRFMLACVRAGLPYVPLDPTTPRARQEFILEDSHARALCLDSRTEGGWESSRAIGRLDLVIGDALPFPPGRGNALREADLLGGTAHRVPPESSGDDIAYILYTSGSTGDPKGVVITHRNAEAFVGWALGHFDLSSTDRVAVHAPLHFDLPVFDIYAGLAAGCAVTPIPESAVLFPESTYRFLREQRVTVLYAVPSALVAMLQRSSLASEGLPDLRLLLYAGEEFHPGPLARLMGLVPRARVFNLYGPIETNVVTVLEIKADHLSLDRIPLGRPISNATVMLLDPRGDVITHTGQEGEIAVSGDCVTPGYLGRPELSASTRTSLRLDGNAMEAFHTGDYGLWDASWGLRFLGRRDQLVKTRGFRVELGDIEASLLKHPKVAEAAVVARPDEVYGNLLHGYVVPVQAQSLDERELRAWCQEHLPPYMVPTKIQVCLDLPRTSTGKISRRLLSDVVPAAPSSAEATR